MEYGSFVRTRPHAGAISLAFQHENAAPPCHFTRNIALNAIIKINWDKRAHAHTYRGFDGIDNPRGISGASALMKSRGSCLGGNWIFTRCAEYATRNPDTILNAPLDIYVGPEGPLCANYSVRSCARRRIYNEQKMCIAQTRYARPEKNRLANETLRALRRACRMLYAHKFQDVIPRQPRVGTRSMTRVHLVHDRPQFTTGQKLRKFRETTTELSRRWVSIERKFLFKSSFLFRNVIMIDFRLIHIFGNRKNSCHRSSRSCGVKPDWYRKRDFEKFRGKFLERRETGS